MRKPLIWLFTLVLLAMLSPSHLWASPSICDGIAGNIVANCGFETGNFTGWTTVPAVADSLFGVTSYANSGNSAAYFGSTGGYNDYIYQNLATTPGDTYSVAFYVFADDTTGEFVANWGGTNIFTLTTPSTGYIGYNFSELATSSSTQLELGGNTPPSYYFLDDVSVVDTGTVASTPEPSSLLLLGSGLLALAGAVRRKLLR
jgi:hypothetical protein